MYAYRVIGTETVDYHGQALLECFEIVESDNLRWAFGYVRRSARKARRRGNSITLIVERAPTSTRIAEYRI